MTEPNVLYYGDNDILRDLIATEVPDVRGNGGR
jgi:hypothetical protein